MCNCHKSVNKTIFVKRSDSVRVSSGVNMAGVIISGMKRQELCTIEGRTFAGDNRRFSPEKLDAAHLASSSQA